jgi:PAS domain S-box-containing protein
VDRRTTTLNNPLETPILQLAVMAAELSAETYRLVLENLPAAVYLVDRERRITLWNKAAESLTGYQAQEVIGRLCRDDILMHCDQNNVILCGNACPLLDTMHDGKTQEAHLFLRHKHGQRIPVLVRAAPVRDQEGTIVGAVEYFEERAILAGARHTGEMGVDWAVEIPDHRTLRAQMESSLNDLAASGIPFGILNIAIDDLERLRGRYGFPGAGAIVYETAQTFLRELCPNGSVGCWSSERLVAIVEGCDQESLEKEAGRLKGLAGRIGVPWWGDRIPVTVSIAGVMAREGDTPETLVARAEGQLKAVVEEIQIA